MQTEQKNFSEWIKNKNQELKQKQEENSQYYQLKIGENIIKIDETQIPIETETKAGYLRYAWQTQTERNGKKLILSASPTLTQMITDALLANINPFTLIKVGEGKNTRYSIKELGR